jgi:RNA polymerase sigma-70 factor (ECF subfamily)
MKITTNCAIDFLRRKKANHCVPLDEWQEHAGLLPEKRAGWGESPEKAYHREEQLRMVREAIAELPAELRLVCLFRTMEEQSTKEVAARLGISALAVRLRLFRAHGQLRKALRRHAPGRRQELRGRSWREGRR